MTITAPGMHRRMPANLDRIGSFFNVGTVTGGGPVKVQVKVDEFGLIGRLLGSRGETRALNSPGFHALGERGDAPRRAPGADPARARVRALRGLLHAGLSSAADAGDESEPRPLTRGGYSGRCGLRRLARRVSSPPPSSAGSACGCPAARATTSGRGCCGAGKLVHDDLSLYGGTSWKPLPSH